MIDKSTVTAILMDCFLKEEKTKEGTPKNGVDVIIVAGVLRQFGLHKERLEAYRQTVSEMLAQLPDPFMSDKGGGWSFLNACVTKDGTQWGEHRNMDELFVLGQGLGFVTYPLPRNMWKALPGGMPYIRIDLNAVALTE